MKKAILLLGPCDEHYIILRTVLESAGYQVNLAENTKQAFDLLNDKKPALIIYGDKKNQDLANELKLLAKENILWWAVPVKKGMPLGSKVILEKVHNLIG